ncbi:hypothetical protein H2204_006782 [Knufia peltigerae]|uniref:Uncharacterized protein n=1 Tax=Knufia peltigerae TaxID=1002370 RepID=A0AA38Y2U4_9EURO|nr:hypothetical protein H2204_006782 [Knufia peltigerae]
MAQAAPSLVLFGPNRQGVLYSVDAQGTQLPMFADNVRKQKPQVQVFRILQNSLHHPIATSSSSSLSGTVTMTLNGQEIKMKPSWEGMQFSMSFESPAGKLTWRPTSWGNGMMLRDKSGTSLAKYVYYKLSGDPQLEIFVPLDDSFLDLVVTAAISVYENDKKSLKTVSKVVKAAAGV